jgi:hypothetical protein
MAQINFNDKNAGDFLTPGDVNSIKNTVNTNEGLISNGTVSGYYDSNNQFRYNHHLIPASNSNFDLGSAEYKIRHLYLSSNSMWVGDANKIESSSGTIKTKKRNIDTLPSFILVNLEGNEVDAIAHAGVSSVAEMTLQQIENYAKSLDNTVTLEDIFPPESSLNYRDADYSSQYQHGADTTPAYLTELNSFDATGGGMWDLDFNTYFANKKLLYIIGDSNNPIAFQITNIPADLVFYETNLFLFQFGPNQSLKFLINGQFLPNHGYQNTGFSGNVILDFKLLKDHLGAWAMRIGETDIGFIRT